MVNAPQYFKRQKQRRDTSKFATLITTPAVDTVVLPGNGRFSVVSTAGCAADTVALNTAGTNDRTIQVAALVAGGRWPIGYFERGNTMTLSSGFELHLEIGLGRWAKIAANT